MTINLNLDFSIVISFISILYVVIKMKIKKISPRISSTRAIVKKIK